MWVCIQIRRVREFSLDVALGNNSVTSRSLKIVHSCTNRKGEQVHKHLDRHTFGPVLQINPRVLAERPAALESGKLKGRRSCSEMLTLARTDSTKALRSEKKRDTGYTCK